MLKSARDHLTGIIDLSKRLFARYLLSSGLMAFVIYLRSEDKLRPDEMSFLRFLFLKRVWSHPSAWLDLRYFDFNSITGKFLLIGLSTGATGLFYNLFANGVISRTAVVAGELSLASQIAISFGFMFPIWDVIFKTYHMPEDNRDVKFGIGEGNADELNTCLRLYWVPFRDAYRVLKAQVKGVNFNMSKTASVTDDTQPAPK